MDISILEDDVCVELLDILMRVLLVDYTGEECLLPEVYEIFGGEYFLKFLDIFAGKSFSVPSHSELEDALMKADIYHRLDGLDVGEEYECVQVLGRRYEMSGDRVRGIYGRLSKSMGMLERVDQEVLKGSCSG